VTHGPQRRGAAVCSPVCGSLNGPFTGRRSVAVVPWPSTEARKRLAWWLLTRLHHPQPQPGAPGSARRLRSRRGRTKPELVRLGDSDAVVDDPDIDLVLRGVDAQLDRSPVGGNCTAFETRLRIAGCTFAASASMSARGPAGTLSTEIVTPRLPAEKRSP